MALSSLYPPPTPTPTHVASTKLHLSSFSFPSIHNVTTSPLNKKWQTNVSFFPAFFNKTKDPTPIKQDLLQAIAPLDRGADATPQDQQIIDQARSVQPSVHTNKLCRPANGTIILCTKCKNVATEIARKLEACNPTKEPLKSSLLNGKWQLIYTTSKSILQIQRPKILRSRLNYQAINVDTLRAQNMEGWPFFNQVTADLTPLNAQKVAVKFDYFKIAGLIPIKAPGRARGELEITYLDEELRVSRGDLGNLFILKMVDPSYKVPT